MKTRILSNTKTKQFTFTTPEYIISNYSQSHRTVIHLQSYHKYTSNYRSDLATVASVHKYVMAKPVSDIDLYVNSVMVKDLELKDKILKQLQITEYVISTTQTLRPLSEQMVQSAKDTIASQKEIVSIMGIVQKNINELSIKDCKKLKAALGNAIYE